MSQDFSSNSFLQRFMREFEADLIVENLYLGSARASDDLEQLKKHGITHILTVAYEFQPKYPQVGRTIPSFFSFFFFFFVDVQMSK
jgi:nicotinic acid phosphoribosyltransferase